jgi:hypothetical protein
MSQQYKGVRYDSDGDLESAYHRLMDRVHVYSEDTALSRANHRWLEAVCDEQERRKPKSMSIRPLTLLAGEWGRSYAYDTGLSFDEDDGA